MGYYGRRTSIFDGFTLYPLPYPVLLILLVISIFFFISSYFSYENAVESAEESMSLVLLATPLILVVIVRWLSSMENPDILFAKSPWDRRRRTHYGQAEGSSPWGVLGFIVLLLILVQYQSIFHDSWFG